MAPELFTCLSDTRLKRSDQYNIAKIVNIVLPLIRIVTSILYTS